MKYIFYICNDSFCFILFRRLATVWNQT